MHFTARGLRQVDFPADEAVRLAGWDGKVLAEEGAPFVPAGFSVWELGTSQDPRAKANDDYGKRTGNPLGIDPRQATFVFVTPRRWPGRDAWAVEKGLIPTKVRKVSQDLYATQISLFRLAIRNWLVSIADSYHFWPFQPLPEHAISSFAVSAK